MKVVASINARMGSTRLPGKSLMDICGEPLLTRVLDRVGLSIVDDAILATTEEPQDDVLIDWAEKKGIPWHRGSTNDVLSRTVDAHIKMGSDIVVRVCGDTPLICPGMIDQAIGAVMAGADISMAPKDRAYPQGVSAHVCKLDSLLYLDETLIDPVSREHVTLHLYESGEYSVHHLRAPWDCPNQRLQVDYKEDLDLVRAIYSRLPWDCGLKDIVGLFNSAPYLRLFNAKCQEKPVR